MLALELLSWWYSRGWASVGKYFISLTNGVTQAFSVPILLRTLFAPWRQIITYPGASFDAKLHAYADNAVSRAVGFVVRLLAILAALAMVGITVTIGTVSIILWPLVPIAALALLIKGITG